jgi:hypothetical protein
LNDKQETAVLFPDGNVGRNKNVYKNAKREVTHAYISDCGFDEIFPVCQVKVGVFVINLKNKNKIKNNK